MSSEHHLGDSLAALIDGELSHQQRERVLAHLVHCAPCKTEADAQRQMKNAFARSPLPAPPAGLMARLQGLPAGPLPPTGGSGSRSGGGGTDPAEDASGGAIPGPAASPRWPRPEQLPAARRAPQRAPRLPRPVPVALPALSGGGFPIHRADASAGPSAGGAAPSAVSSAPAASPLRAPAPQRGHRFAFAAAGAFSLAAFAIGGLSAAGAPPAPSAGGGSAMVSAGGSASASPSPSRSGATSREEARYGQFALRAGAYPGQRQSPMRGLFGASAPSLAEIVSGSPPADASGAQDSVRQEPSESAPAPHGGGAGEAAGVDEATTGGPSVNASPRP